MRVNEQEITLNSFNALKFPDEGVENCSFVSTIDMLVQEQIQGIVKNYKMRWLVLMMRKYL